MTTVLRWFTPIRRHWRATRVKVYNNAEDKITNCIQCKALIINYELIITLLYDHPEYGVTDLETYHLECYNKSTNFLKYHWPDCTDNLLGFNELYENQQQHIQRILFPSISSIKFQLKSPCIDINEIDENILKIMLQKRNLRIYTQISKYHTPKWNVINAQINLNAFRNSAKCIEKKECLISGYCNQYGNTYQMLIPQVIKPLILRYCVII